MGIGRVDHYDHAKRVRLGQALSYLAKRDQYVRVKPGCKCRVFQTGGMKAETTIGRPRMKVLLWDEMPPLDTVTEQSDSALDTDTFDTAMPETDAVVSDDIDMPDDGKNAVDEEAA